MGGSCEFVKKKRRGCPVGHEKAPGKGLAPIDFLVLDASRCQIARMSESDGRNVYRGCPKTCQVIRISASSVEETLPAKRIPTSDGQNMYLGCLKTYKVTIALM